MATKGIVKIHSEHITAVFPSFTVLFGGRQQMIQCSMPMAMSCSSRSMKKSKRSKYFEKCFIFVILKVLLCTLWKVILSASFSHGYVLSHRASFCTYGW